MDNRSWADYAYPFAAWDVRLYLDTHPDDTEALETYRSLCRQAQNAGIPCGGYACHIPDDTAAGWTWISDPWPWEPDANIVSGSRCGCTDTPIPASAEVSGRADGRSCGCGGSRRPCTPCECKPMPDPVPAARNAQRNASGIGSGRSAYHCI